MIAIASDHAGFVLKEKVRQLLDELQLKYKDFGAYNAEPSDYPDFGYIAAKSVGTGECDRGILVCGSGIGMDIVANKVRDVRAALCTNVEMAEVSRKHNDANIIVLGARFTDWDNAEKMVRIWLSTPFEGGRHKRRVDKVNNLGGC